MNDRVRVHICLFFLLVLVTALSTVGVYAEENYPWTITFVYGGFRAGGDVYSIKVNFNEITKTVPCEFKTVAFYNSDNELLAVSSSNSTERQQTFSVKCTQDPALVKAFAWDTAQNMQPVSEVGIYTIEKGIYYSYVEKKVEEPHIVNLQFVGITPVEVKGLYPEVCCTYGETEDVVKYYKDEEFFEIENNQFSVKENGSYLIYAKDDSGVEYTKWIYTGYVQGPEPELFFDSAYYNEGDEAYLYVRLKNQNSNAEIVELGLLNYRPGIIIGGLNHNVLNNMYLEETIPVKDGDVITVTEPGTYTLVAKDSWGNTGLCGIVINDINHDYLRTDSNDSRYQITYDPEDK